MLNIADIPHVRRRAVGALALPGCRGNRCREAGLLGGFFILVMVPGAHRGVDEAAKEEDEADEQNDPGHATVKPMSFSHSSDLTH